MKITEIRQIVTTNTQTEHSENDKSWMSLFKFKPPIPTVSLKPLVGLNFAEFIFGDWRHVIGRSFAFRKDRRALNWKGLKV